MSQASSSDANQFRVGTDTTGTRSPATTIDPTATLTLLSDEHAREILEVLGDKPLPAREIFERLDMSRATVYRRLERLESAGLA